MVLRWVVGRFGKGGQGCVTVRGVKLSGGGRGSKSEDYVELSMLYSTWHSTVHYKGLQEPLRAVKILGYLRKGHEKRKSDLMTCSVCFGNPV